MKVEIEKLDHFGRGITHINGKICFIDKALPGEVVKIKIIKDSKKYMVGKIVDYYKLSDDRIDEVCRYSDICGGCSLSHLTINEENKFKCMKVKELLERFGSISSEKVCDVICLDEYGYRNKVTLHGQNSLLGYCENGSNRVFNVDKCLLANEKINGILEILNKMSFNESIDEAVVRCSNDSSEVMVSLKGDISDYSSLRNVVDTLIINDEVLLGDESIVSNIGNKKFYVSDGSFFQVNKNLTKKLYDEVLDVVKCEKPKKILDLYCGTGTIGIYVSDYTDSVIGVDYSKEGINDANKNKELNNCKNIKFICDKVENVIDQFDDIDMVIVDPPRAGLDNKTIDNIKRIAAETVVYVSCDPATLGRDLKYLSDSYDVIEVKPFNMFPRTYHIENFVLLRRKNNG
ncbi:MAG: 23S rRNA (uracil(1939)-C(5))-methyltransferase RlmD [Bacilli bacterium]|nr:23S rRNA (uracil(1939)-C(5))-methyltransferase RlmD [Bacilli bacterium]